MHNKKRLPNLEAFFMFCHFQIFATMFKYFFIFIIVQFFVSCIAKTVTVNEKSGFSEIKLDYAKNFRLFEKNNRFKVEIINPDNNSVEEVFYFGSKKSDIKIPSGNLVSLSSTTNGMLVKLRALDGLTGVSSINYVFSPEIKKRFNSGDIVEFGDEASYSPENLIKHEVKMVLYSGFGKEFPNNDKLKQFGITTIPVYDWRETHPLGKAEWIKFLGLITGKYEEALRYFENVKEEYLSLTKLTKNILKEPKVISGNLYGDSWNAPGGGSYMARIFKDAGADYRYKDNNQTGSIQYSLETILTDNNNTEFWFNPGFSKKSEILKVNENLRLLPPFENNTYCYSGNMSLYWEFSAIEPHKVLSDLIAILHPEILPAEKLYFYKKIEN